MRQTITITGLSGLVGSRVAQLLTHEWDVQPLGEQRVDITDAAAVDAAVAQAQDSWILHFAAKTDVESCERDKVGDLAVLGVGAMQEAVYQQNARNVSANDSTAWQVNVIGTKHMAAAARKYHKKLLYVSTDFVFDGSGLHTETDTPAPLNWYGWTKYQGERVVAQHLEHFLIVRIAFPYRAHFGLKPDFVRTIRGRLEKNKDVHAPSDNLFTPTFVDDIGRAIHTLLINNCTGIYHAVGSSSHSSDRVATMIARTFGLNSGLVKPVAHGVYYHSSAPRPLTMRIGNAKIASQGVSMLTFEQGLMKVKNQLSVGG